MERDIIEDFEEPSEEEKKAHHHALYKVLPVLSSASILFMTITGFLFIYSASPSTERGGNLLNKTFKSHINIVLYCIVFINL